jgi:zinc and cadmium transporter
MYRKLDAARARMKECKFGSIPGTSMLEGVHRESGYDAHTTAHRGPENHTETARPAGILILIGDGFHNFLDGILIASSFAFSIPVGIVTAVAVVAHEIPQELGDL